MYLYVIVIMSTQRNINYYHIIIIYCIGNMAVSQQANTSRDSVMRLTNN